MGSTVQISSRKKFGPRNFFLLSPWNSSKLVLLYQREADGIANSVNTDPDLEAVCVRSFMRTLPRPVFVGKRCIQNIRKAFSNVDLYCIPLHSGRRN